MRGRGGGGAGGRGWLPAPALGFRGWVGGRRTAGGPRTVHPPSDPLFIAWGLGPQCSRPDGVYHAPAGGGTAPWTANGILSRSGGRIPASVREGGLRSPFWGGLGGGGRWKRELRRPPTGRWGAQNRRKRSRGTAHQCTTPPHLFFQTAFFLCERRKRLQMRRAPEGRRDRGTAMRCARWRSAPPVCTPSADHTQAVPCRPV